MNNSVNSTWRRAAPAAIVITLFILGLFYYWYAVADRYVIFLYGHTTVGITNAQPFDEVTSSRYWMAGLVASGAVMVLYIAANGLWGRVAAWLKRPFVPAEWWRVWTLCAAPLSGGIPAITMTVNWPTLPAALALQGVVATLAGLAVALLPGRWAAERPADLAWLAADGLGLMPVLLMLHVVELPARGISLSQTTAWLVSGGSVLFGLFWLVAMTLLRRWRRKEMPGASALFLSGIAQSYVLLPLVHHLLGTPPAYRYLSTASNFFAFNFGLQLLALVVAGGLAVGVSIGRSTLMVSPNRHQAAG